jgi:hypothetical protein
VAINGFGDNAHFVELVLIRHTRAVHKSDGDNLRGLERNACGEVRDSPKRLGRFSSAAHS